jgi:hypothetical protein
LLGIEPHVNLRRADFSLPESPLDDLRNVAGEIQTAVPEVASRVRDGAGTVATEAADALQHIREELDQLLERLRGILPLNVTIGMAEFCVGFPQRRSCLELPPHIDLRLPEAASAILDNTMPVLAQAVSDTQEVLSLSSQLTTQAVQISWAVPVALMVLMAAVTIIMRHLGVIFCFLRPALFFIWSLSVLLSTLSLVIPLWATHRMEEKAGDLPNWITMTVGGSIECYSYALCCLGVHAVLCLVGFL